LFVVVGLFLRQHLTLDGPLHLPLTRVTVHLVLSVLIQILLIPLSKHGSPTPSTKGLVIFFGIQHLTSLPPGHKLCLIVPVQLFHFNEIFEEVKKYIFLIFS